MATANHPLGTPVGQQKSPPPQAGPAAPDRDQVAAANSGSDRTGAGEPAPIVAWPPGVVPGPMIPAPVGPPGTGPAPHTTLAGGAVESGRVPVESAPRRADGPGPRVTAAAGATAPAASAPAGAADHPSRTGPARQTAAPDRAARSRDNAPADGEDAAEMLTAAVGLALAGASPAFVLGDRADGELTLARTLLRSILAVVDDSPLAPAWAVSVMRHPSGLAAFVTSTEGRGWLPAGLFLPREVSTPWVWEAAEDAPWEGLADPARVLAEFGLVWGAARGAGFAAIASSHPIDDALRRQLRGVPLAAEVTPAPELNFAEPGPGLVDRLGFTAAPRLLDRVAAVPLAAVPEKCVTLAQDAQARVAHLTAAAVDVLGAPELRGRILQAVSRGQPVAADRWDELWKVDALLAASAVAHRRDVSRIPLGELRSESKGPDAAVIRTLALQRHCDELVRLLADPPDRHSLRDAVYLHGLIAEHPTMREIASVPRDNVSLRRR
ncbi:hypothetical protein [Nocardia sp. NPDC004722]